MLQSLEDSRRELALATAVAVCLVLLRSTPATLFEGFYFDSDQAIVGLMAKHLAAFHDFPLYYYGQNYMLGVQAWIIAPFFWVFRPSVTVMRIPLVLLNIVAAVWLIRALSSKLALRPMLAFVAALPFVAAAPPAATHLLEAGGASIEPIIYVLLLWALRRRPIAFGVLLAIGFQHREWTIFALPAVVIAEAATGDLWSWSSVRRVGWMICGFAAAWLVLDDIKMHLTAATAALQVVQLSSGLCFDADTRQRVAALVLQVIPPLFGAAALPPFSLGMSTTESTGHPLVGWVAAITIACVAIRLLWIWRPARATQAAVTREDGFALYLVCVGVFALLAYPLSCTIVFGGMPLLRYVLFGLLVPVGLIAAFLRYEPSRVLRQIVVCVTILWAAAGSFDTSRILVAASRTPPPNEHRVLTDYLISHGIRYARAKYWDTYIIDFLSRERVIVASIDTFRIPEYQREVDAHADVAVELVRQPCRGFATVASWCLQR